MQIADKQAKDRKKDESVDEISDQRRIKKNLERLVWNTNMIMEKRRNKNTYCKDRP